MKAEKHRWQRAFKNLKKIDTQILFLAFVICCSIYLPKVIEWFYQENITAQLILGENGIEICTNPPCSSAAISPKNLDSLLILGRPIPVNLADAALLSSVPGIGMILATRIIETRQKTGPFHSKEALQQVSGIGPKQSEKFSTFLDFREEKDIYEH